MKALTLYIDKWYIIGAVCTDGVPRLIRPKTGEECFWLYFYEDTANDDIVYGKDNKQHYHNNENHYYGDVFSLLTDNKTSFIRFGRKQSIEKIFKASGIIDELKSALGDEKMKIETYISFARDISDQARYIFRRDVLEPENFEIKEFVARIGHLSLEHAFRHNLFSEEGYYLLLNACNENLIYSLYEYKDNLLLRKAENCLAGMGTDLRSRAILENVVKSINLRNHFLNTQKEFEQEYLRLSQFVDDWIVRLGNAKPGRPVTIPNVSFAKIGNTYQATILKKDIDARTSAIVDDIIREIVTFVRNSGVTNDKVHGVLFLGNTFSNSQFLSAIKEQYTLPNEKYVHYKASDLPNIVAVYTVMDCSQFSVATEMSEKKGEAEIERQKLVQEEEDRRRKAEEDRKKKEEEYRAAHEAEIRYEEAMRNVYDFEKKQDYAQMAEWAGIALNHKSDDPEALKKKNDATRLLSEQKVREEQYRGIITRAQECFKNGQWQDAKSQSEAALNLKPESTEAKRIYTQSAKKIEAAVEIEKYLTRADLFLAQKSYDEALQELKKVQSYDPENEEALNRIKEIGEIRKEHDDKVSALTSQYELAKKTADFKMAISVCEQLADLDSINQKKWSKEAEKLRSEEENYQKELKRFEDLLEKVTGAYFDEKWADVIHFAEDALQIKEDEKLRLRIAEANIKLKEKEEKAQYENSVHRVNELLLAEDFEEAESLINQLQRDFPQHKDQIKGLRKRMMDQQFRSLKKAPNPEPRELDTKKPPMPKSDDFFGDGTVQKPQSSKPTPSPSKEGSTQQKKPEKVVPTKDDFFGSSYAPKSKPSKQTSTAIQKKPAAPPKKPSSKGAPTGIDFFDS
jgi:uncharacterized protein HemY